MNYQNSSKRMEGMSYEDSYMCYSSIKHMVWFNNYFFPCSISVRNSSGSRMGRMGVESSLVKDLNKWRMEHDCTEDSTCLSKCPIVLKDFNNKWKEAVINKAKKGL